VDVIRPNGEVINLHSKKTSGVYVDEQKMEQILAKLEEILKNP